MRNQFTFLHTYEATGRYWQGLEKAGLIRPGCGVRFINPAWADDEYTFDKAAAHGGKLHRIISERKCPMVVDRVVGGSPYNPRNYDQSLISEYATLLGENFIGGQVHETICNTINDWNNLTSIKPEYAKSLRKKVRSSEIKAHFDWSNARHWLEYGSVEDYDGKVYPADRNEFMQAYSQNLRKQGAKFGSHFCYCEGAHFGELNWHEAYKNGAGWCFAEVGPWASVHTQFMIAALRGSAKAARKPWGVFYAPWGPEGCTCMIDPAANTWKMQISELSGSGWAAGPEYGPSSALQRRSFFHAYLSGAYAIHEEWGAESNLLDWDSGELSSYGEATREFLDFIDSYPDVGEPYTPVALTFDTSDGIIASIIDAPFGGKALGFYPPNSNDIAWAQVKLGLYGFACLSKNSRQYDWAGTGECYCYSPCEFPEIFDIVPDNAPADVLASYSEVIAIGGARPHSHPLAQINAVTDALQNHSPFLRTGDMTMQVNYRKSDGAWIVGLYNPRGAKRGDVYGLGSILNESFTAKETLKPLFNIKSARVLYSWPSGRLEVNGDELDVTVGPGGVMILEIQESHS